MFVRVFENSFSQEVFDLGFQSIWRVLAHRSGGSILLILTQVRDHFGYSPHPADMVGRALKVYAGFLSGQAERQILMPLSTNNGLLKPRDGRGLCLDLTGKQIQILEELSPVDADGNIRLDEMQSRVLRTLSYNQDAAAKIVQAATPAQARIVSTPDAMRVGGKVYRDGVCTGIYLGIWEPKDRDGQSIGKKFRIFAAPEDLTDKSGQRTLMTFQDTAKHLTTKRDWHGYDGGDYVNDTALYNALRKGRYKGEWFIPTRELLCGRDVWGNLTQTDNLHAHKDIGAFNGTFITLHRGSDCGYPEWYWSCTEDSRDRSNVWNMRFSGRGDDGDSNGQTFLRFSCRPVRAEAFVP